MKYLLLFFLFFSQLELSAQNSMNKPFEDCNIEGSTTIFDYQNQKWISSDISHSAYATLPASTFKILNTLIALESGVIKDENEIIIWPGETDRAKYGYRPNIYKDMSMKDAFRLSAGWAYIELAKKIGKERYQYYLDLCHYGNADISINDADFWNFGQLVISPINQIQILIGIHEESLPFSKRSFEILRKLMLVEQNDSYSISAKTGWTRDFGKDTGWWVGYITKADNIYFFATLIIKERTTKNPNFGNCRKEITLKILNQLDIIE